MSESEVSHIQDEDVLRRMWQATEDFGRKKEIRAHMYRLREERLRSLYSPEPAHAPPGKGVEFSAAGHGRSFADQTFQSMKSKEVRDAASPPKEFSYRGQDLKELSNAGWNVESEERTADGGRTHETQVNANIEGQYEVEGGRGQFAAADRQRRVHTARQDAHSSLRRDEAVSDTSARDHVERCTEDGARLSSTTTSSSTSSRVQQVSETTHNAPPVQHTRAAHHIEDDHRLTRITDTTDYEQTLRSADTSRGELVSRKVEYPDDNTKVIVETHVLADGTRLTSTRREFRAAAHSARAEHSAHTETKSYSEHRSSDHRDSTSSATRHTVDDRRTDIVNSQRNVDNYDFKRQLREYSGNDKDDRADTQQRRVTKTNRNVADHSQTNEEYSQKRSETKIIDRSTTSRDDCTQTHRHTVDRLNDNQDDKTYRHHTTTSQDRDVQHNIIKETHRFNDSDERFTNSSRDISNKEEIVQHVTADKTHCDNRVREVSKDGTVPVDIIHKTPKDDTPTTTNIRDAPRDETAPEEKPSGVSKDRPDTDENDLYRNKDTKVEEVIERKTSSEHYQTTYQNDYQTRKVSSDWSPTHQAWASTLRSDTPSTTRPSTRASSPGSRTFKSSTSSLRSSVSPDKTYKKPSSRGGSPNKVDRYSPTRTVTSDRYSSTHSTHSVTEERINKNTSPERRPPTGHSPARSGYSPDRKPQEGYRQRPSVSPEKRPKNSSEGSNLHPKQKPTEGRSRPSSPIGTKKNPDSPTAPKQSPERRPTKPSTENLQSSPYRSTASPGKKPVDSHPPHSSPSSSPDRISGYSQENLIDSPTSSKPTGYTPIKSGTTSDKNPSLEQPLTQDLPVKRPSTSPDRKPNYMKPTVTSSSDEKRPDRRSPSKQTPVHNLNRNPQDFDKTTKIKEDHYKSVDEETKVYTQTNKPGINTKLTETSDIEMSRRHTQSPSQINNVPSEDCPDYCKAPQSYEQPINQNNSPTKDTVIITENDELYGRVEKIIDTINITNKQDMQTNDTITKTRITENIETSKEKEVPSRETSPSKYGTYDKKKPREEVDVSVVTTEDIKFDSLTRKDKTSFTKRLDAQSTKKSPRDSVSPIKSPIKDTKYKHTTDFISSEKTTEQMNKKNTGKDHPRQLLTPSSSPTRKPRPSETEPSTGQSSPTTSVSGFIYFSSPRTERPMITDLDEFNPDSENLEDTTKRPNSLDVKRSPSPSKIPCRSPSPEKHIQTTKENLPRKSSLKKPTTGFTQGSPVEKPPTSFRVSPINDKPDIPDHKVVEKDQPNEPETGEPVSHASKYTDKPKPPLQRRETYDDRCKKILGLVDDTTAETIIKENRRQTRKPDSSQTSPSVSPCDSPAPNDPLILSNSPASKKTTKVDVTNFISHEREDLSKCKVASDQKDTKVPSRDTSPTKSRDIITNTKIVTDRKTKDEIKEDTTTQIVKPKSPRQSPEKCVLQDPSKDSTQKRHSESPERKRTTSPSKPTQSILTRQNIDKTTDNSKTTTVTAVINETTDNVQNITKLSRPTRVLESPTRETPRSSKILPDHRDDTQPQESPEKTPGYMKSTTAITSKFDTHYTTVDVDKTYLNRTQEQKEPRIKSSSPTRQKLRATSPTKLLQPSESSPMKPDLLVCPQNKPAPTQQTEDKQVPGYMKTTKSATTKFDQTTITEDAKETTKISTFEKTHISSVSPTRKSKSPNERRTPSPSKPSRPSEITINKHSQSLSPEKDSALRKFETKHTTTSSPTRQYPEKAPGYLKTTESVTHKHETTEYKNSITEDNKVTSSNPTELPSQYISKTTDTRSSAPENHRTKSLSKQSSPHRKSEYPSKDDKPSDKHPRDVSPTNLDETPGYMKTTTATSSKFETTSTTADIQENTTYKQVTKKPCSETPIHGSTDGSRPRTLSPSKPNDTPRGIATSPERIPESMSPIKGCPLAESNHPKHTSGRPSSSPEKPSYMKPTASIISKFDSSTTSREKQENLVQIVDESISRSPKKKNSPGRKSPERESMDCSGYQTKPEEPRQLRTPSPVKKTTTITESNTDFIMSEREQEILNKVQTSLRKLSPERKEKSASRERSPSKTTTSLQDIDIISSETVEVNKSIDENQLNIVEEQFAATSKVPRPTQLKGDKLKDQKAPSKPTSRNVSPIKRTPSSPGTNKVDKSPESPTKSRSFSPKKVISNVERPQSPHQPKNSGIKPREQVPAHLTRKATPATLSTTKIERLTTDVKKTNGVTKQNVLSKTTSKTIPSPSGKSSEPDNKRTFGGDKDNASPKKNAVTRTTSDIAMKPKKTSSPQRMKSKPEIQVSDMSTKSPKYQKPIIKEPHSKLTSKPKSATSLNTSVEEDDIIIDVQQSKSSRENSPDRICPTPINFADDIGIPRFPDEVSEPDDELVKRNHHTIQETESVVDDIVEICEDEELFTKKTGMEVITEQDDSLLSVNDKVNKFTSKIHSVNKLKDTTVFKDTEKRVHSDFIDESLKSDECLLTVSEKVNKFAKGPRDTKDRSPSRKITDEYDKNTFYTDDYTKLSVNDKAHLFVETAENVKASKTKPAQKVERPDLCNVDDSLKSDDCLLSVSDKVNKFGKTAEQCFTETQEVEEKETKIKEKHQKIMKQIFDEDDEVTYDTKETVYPSTDNTVVKDRQIDCPNENQKTSPKEPKSTQSKVNDYKSPSTKPVDRVPAVKITTLRSSEAVKKAKALFENIASTQKTTHSETSNSTKTTKLTDIGVIKKTPKSDSTTVLHPSIENVSPQIPDIDDEVDVVLQTKRPSNSGLTKRHQPHMDNKPCSVPNHLAAQSPEVPRSKSPMRQNVEVTTTKTVLSRYPAATRAESPRQRPESPRPRTESPRQRPDSDKLDNIPGYLKPTKTSQIKEETKVVEETEVSTRRGSGKFGVELRRTSVERSTVSSERRRSVEHHQPCIEDIFDLDLLEQMLEKVVGYEQRRRIRAQIRIAKNQSEHIESNSYTKTTKLTTTVPKTRSPERKMKKSPERAPKSTVQKTLSPERHYKSTPQKTIPEPNKPKESTMNGHTKEPLRATSATRQRPQSPEKPAPKSNLAPRNPVRQPSPDKRRTTSPSKTTPKPKSNRFSEYATAYMKKVGLNEADKNKYANTKSGKVTGTEQALKHETQQKTVQEFTTTRCFTERTSSKDVIEIVQTNGKRSPSPEQRQSPGRKVQFPDHETQIPERKAKSPERRPYTPDQKAQNPERKTYSPDQKAQSPDRLYQRTPSPDFKRPKSDNVKETIIKTVYDIDKKIPSKPIQEEKPSWVTNRNLKKITSESRTFSSKKIESEKTKYRAPSPSKIIAKPIDVITSSYGPGPLDADGKPLFGIKALRNGATNFQVKGTVIRQEFHSRNGGEPEGSVSVTAYSSQPEELERLLAAQGAPPPSRLHGLAAITTTRRFGGDTGSTLSNVHTKEDRASLEQFTHHDRRVEHLQNRAHTTTRQHAGDVTLHEILEPSTRVQEILEPSTGSQSSRDARVQETKLTTRTEGKDNRQDRPGRTSSRDDTTTHVKRQKVEERRAKMEKREDKKTVRQSSVKSLTEKFIKSANDSGKSDRSAYPKAGLILRTTAAARDSVSSDDAHPAGGLQRAASEHSVCSVEDTVVSTSAERAGGVRTTTTRTTHHHHATTHHEPLLTRSAHEQRTGATLAERSFLDSTTKVTGVQDILTRMKNADIVIEDGDTTEDSEARALLNKFLGATVLMAGMQGYVNDQPGGKVTIKQETVCSSSGGKATSRSVHELDLDQCWDEQLLNKLLEECTDYEQRRRLRARIRTLMAEQEACASAVTEALGATATEGGASESGEAREEEEVTMTSSVRRDSSDKTVSTSTTTRTSKVVELTRPAPKPVSPFAKFRQLEKQNSINSPNSPKTPQSPGSPSQPYFKFTDPALQCSALTIKERLLQWCRDKTRDYENVKLENFSTSWADGLAFCALVHHFLPDAFDYSKLTPDKRRHNFTLAFKVADEKAGIYPLLDVDDMVAMRKPDWKCVFTYVQAIYRRFKDEQ